MYFKNWNLGVEYGQFGKTYNNVLWSGKNLIYTFFNGKKLSKIVNYETC